jgi:hypothetical protein
VLPLGERLWRVYFAARDRDNRAHIVAVDIDPGEQLKIVAEHLDPLLELGPPGAFDHEGMGPSCALVVGDQVRLYYTGVAVRRDVRVQLAIGLAVSEDGLRFRKQFPGPILATGPFDPYFTGSPVVRPTPDGFRMWYTSGTEWRLVRGQLDYFYEIRTTTSDDGLMWDIRTESARALEAPAEAGMGRAWMIDAGDGPRLWYSRRGENYRAPGEDPYRIVSVRADETGEFTGPAEPLRFENPPAAGDFDSWMQAYPCVVVHGDDLIMFYNGNEFGREGLGWARLAGGARRPASP